MLSAIKRVSWEQRRALTYHQPASRQSMPGLTVVKAVMAQSERAVRLHSGLPEPVAHGLRSESASFKCVMHFYIFQEVFTLPTIVHLLIEECKKNLNQFTCLGKNYTSEAETSGFIVFGFKFS